MSVEGRQQTAAAAPAGLRAVLVAQFAAVSRLLSRRAGRRFPAYRHPAILRTENLIGLAILIVGSALVFADPLTVPLRQLVSPEVYRFFRTITDVGDSAYILIPTGVFCLLVLARDWSAMENKIKAGLNRAFVYSGYVFIVVASSGLFVIVLKIVFGRSRPRFFEEVGAYAFNFFTMGAHNASFPSGHATTVAAFCTALILIFPRWRLVILAFGLLGAFSRVFVGAHYPSDVLLGILIGVAFAHRTAVYLGRRGVGFRITTTGRLKPTGLGWPLVAVKKLLQNPR